MWRYYFIAMLVVALISWFVSWLVVGIYTVTNEETFAEKGKLTLLECWLVGVSIWGYLCKVIFCCAGIDNASMFDWFFITSIEGLFVCLGIYYCKTIRKGNVILNKNNYLGMLRDFIKRGYFAFAFLYACPILLIAPFLVVDGIHYRFKNFTEVICSGGNGHDIVVPSTAGKDWLSYEVCGISDGAFKNDPRHVGISSLQISEGVIYIGPRAFKDNYDLETVSLPEGLTTIEYAAFEGCCRITSIRIPESVTNIGMCAFSRCKSLRHVVFKGKSVMLDPFDFLETSPNIEQIEVPMQYKEYYLEELCKYAKSRFGDNYEEQYERYRNCIKCVP